MATDNPVLACFARRKADGDVVRVCAPMVRYSKLAFRRTVMAHGVDIAYTPMMVAQSFAHSQRARDVEFHSNAADHPLVAQFAAHNAHDFATAAQLITPYADAVDLNCGCPQRWAAQEGIGACLIKKPELIADMVAQARSRTHLPVTVKIRVCPDDKDTVELVRRIEHAGAAWLTVHGRTASQRTEPVNLARIKLVKDAVAIPVVANGDVCSLEDARRTQVETGVDGVMAARGLLANPGMFAGHACTTHSVLRDYVRHALATGTAFNCLHHHVMFMLEKICSKIAKKELNTLTSMAALLDYIRDVYDINIADAEI